MKNISPISEKIRKTSRKRAPRAVRPATNGKISHAASKGVRSVCVYCGSGHGNNPAYAASARVLGRSLAEAGITLVYGGGGLGLMGEVATATLEAGGRVIGIIPEFLTVHERMLRDVDELIVTEDMHQRKKLMFEKSDGFVALPGGVGTLEELVEQLTWSQLGQHTKPIVVANIAEFWSPFLNLIAHMRNEAFIRPGLDVRFGVVNEASQIVPRLQEIHALTGGIAEPDTLEKL